MLDEFLWGPYNVTMDFVYHGSRETGLKIITRHKSTHQKECVYAVCDKVIALLFASNEKCNGDYDRVISYDNGIPVLVERWPNVLNTIYDTRASLYKLDAAHFNHYDYLWEPEVISFYDEPVLEEIKIDNVLEKLKSYHNEGRLKIYDYPNRPDSIPVDNSDLIEQAKRFEAMGFAGAEKQLYALYPQLKAFGETDGAR